MKLPTEVRHAIGRVAEIHREDAEQEAWLALLEGRDPLHSVQTFAAREYRYSRRELNEQAREQLPKEPRELDSKYLVPRVIRPLRKAAENDLAA